MCQLSQRSIFKTSTPTAAADANRPPPRQFVRGGATNDLPQPEMPLSKCGARGMRIRGIAGEIPAHYEDLRGFSRHSQGIRVNAPNPASITAPNFRDMHLFASSHTPRSPRGPSTVTSSSRVNVSRSREPGEIPFVLGPPPSPTLSLSSRAIIPNDRTTGRGSRPSDQCG